MFALYSIVGLLVFTGGYYHRSDQFHFEIAQVDPFAWAVLVLWVVRRQLSGKWLSNNEQKFANTALQFIQRQPITLLSVAIGLYIAFHFWISSWRYDSFHANAYDLSFVLQSIWGTNKIGFLSSSLSTGGSYLGEHFSPLLAVFAPLYRLWSEAYILFLAQTVILGGSALIVYKIGRARKIPREWAVVVASLFLIYQPLRLANIFDLREDNLFVPVFLFAFLSLERRRYGFFVFSCVLSWLIKENAGVFTALLGTWLLVRRKERKAALGSGLAIASALVFVMVNLYVTPHFSGEGPTMLTKRLGVLGTNNADLFGASLSNPLASFSAIFDRVLNRENFRYAAKVLVPFLLFAWASPFVFMIALIGLLMNLILGVKLGFHYECVLIPFLFYTLICGVHALLAGNVSFFGRRVAVGRPELIMGTTLLFLLFFGRSPSFTARDFRPDERDVFISKILSQIPQDVSVTAQPIIHPHVCARKQAELFRGQAPTTDYAIFDLSPWRDQWGVHNLEKVAGSMDMTVYQKIVDTDGFLVFKKFAAPGLLSVQ